MKANYKKTNCYFLINSTLKRELSICLLLLLTYHALFQTIEHIYLDSVINYITKLQLDICDSSRNEKRIAIRHICDSSKTKS